MCIRDRRDSALDAAATQSVGQTDGRRGLALARGRWVDGSDEDELGLVVDSITVRCTFNNYCFVWLWTI